MMLAYVLKERELWIIDVWVVLVEINR